MEAGTALNREGEHEKKESVLERMVSGPPSSSQLRSGRRAVIQSGDCPGKQSWL